jgi:hypothetical protein
MQAFWPCYQRLSGSNAIKVAVCLCVCEFFSFFSSKSNRMAEIDVKSIQQQYLRLENTVPSVLFYTENNLSFYLGSQFSFLLSLFFFPSLSVMELPVSLNLVRCHCTVRLLQFRILAILFFVLPIVSRADIVCLPYLSVDEVQT